MSDMSNPPYGTIGAEYAARLASTAPEDDGPVWMLNLMSYHEVAQYTDGREERISGREADDRYNPLDILTELGAELVFAAEVDTQLLGESPSWDRVAMIKYPTRQTFLTMQDRPDFQAKYVHKEAGMAETIIAGCQPMGSPADDLDPSTLPDWAEVAHPPTDDDGPVVVLHLIRFHPGEAEGEMLEYQRTAAETAVPQGVRISGWFGVEGTIIGDGREWDQVRFNAFPSRAAFMAVVTDPARLEAQEAHRETAIADTYTMILRPMIDRMADSTAATGPTIPTNGDS